MSRTIVMRLSLVAAMLLLVTTVGPGQVQAAEEERVSAYEHQELYEILRTAKPAPQTGRHYTPEESATPDRRRLVGYDPATGEQTVYPPSQLSFDGPGSQPGWEGVAPSLWGSDQIMTPVDWGSSEGEGFAEFAEGERACTPPNPTIYTHAFPFNTVFKLLMRYDVGGADSWWVCSASSFGSFHILTAGHCVYSHDPDGTGTAPAQWATEIWAWAAQTDAVNPFFGDNFPEDRPYSFAKMVYPRTYTGWTGSGDLNWDIGFIALDRRDPDHTGWMGRQWGNPVASLNFNGYPSETPYVPAGEILQYPGWDADNVYDYTSNRIELCAYTYGGHSGGPVWYYDGTNRYVHGVNSTSNRVGYAEATLIVEQSYNDMATIITDDEANRPPVARPDLAEYVFTYADDAKDLVDNTVAQNADFDVVYNAFNTGFAATGSMTIDFYLSSNDIISDMDYYVGSVTWGGGLDAWMWTGAATTSLNAGSTPTGTYYVGWIMNSTVAEYSGDANCTNDPCTNVVIIRDETLTVTTPTCIADAWEPDNSAGEANYLYLGSPQTHSICPIGDEDWVYFILPETMGVTLETSGPSGDTRMWLYDAALTEIEFNDDGGTGYFSYIDRVCGTDPLPAGTYYVEIDEYGDNAEIPDYTVTIGLTSCGPDLIFEDGFESGNTSAWSSTVP